MNESWEVKQIRDGSFIIVAWCVSVCKRSVSWVTAGGMPLLVSKSSKCRKGISLAEGDNLWDCRGLIGWKLVRKPIIVH